MEKLQQLLDEGVIDEIYNQLKTGKEAEVWLVSHHGEPVAAKIYKAREFRSFKNDAGYKEGRQVRNTRTQRAMDKGSKFGRQSAEDAWKSMEADTMFNLHAAGVRCPKPVMFYEGVLLMEVIGDAEGRVAPRLVEAAISREQAEGLYVTLRQEVIKMLAEDVIHGDLSEFNILLGANGPVIIDFPQVITAAKNSQSEKYFRRDLGNLVRFFTGLDPTLEQRHAGDADEIWREYVRRDLSPSFVPSGRRFHGGDRGGHHARHGGGGRDGQRGPAQGQRPGDARGAAPGQGSRGERGQGQAAQGGQGFRGERGQGQGGQAFRGERGQGQGGQAFRGERGQGQGGQGGQGFRGERGQGQGGQGGQGVRGERGQGQGAQGGQGFRGERGPGQAQGGPGLRGAGPAREGRPGRRGDERGQQGRPPRDARGGPGGARGPERKGPEVVYRGASQPQPQAEAANSGHPKHPHRR